MALTEFSAAINQVATERGISVESVLESVQQALATAYRKDRKEHGENVDLEEIVVDLDSDTGEVRILKDSKDVTPAGFGRIAAQTAKQVILQKIRETEKETIAAEYRAKIGEIVNGIVFRVENNIVTLDLGKTHAHGIMLQSDQVPGETYRTNQRIRILIRDVREGPRGTEILVSRSSPDFVKKLFEQEVPEIATGVVKIEAIAREAGSRTKMAVSSTDDKVDPVGSCVGQKGVRVQSIISELFGEKIDIVPFSPLIEKFIAASLSPARVSEVELDKKEKRAVVTVPEDQQSLAIGKEGQNARLANKLTKWKIDIKGASGVFVTGEESAEQEDQNQVVGVWDAEIQKSRDKAESEKSESTSETNEEEESERTNASDMNDAESDVVEDIENEEANEGAEGSEQDDAEDQQEISQTD